MSANAMPRPPCRSVASSLLAAAALLAAVVPAFPAIGRPAARAPTARVLARPAALGPACVGLGWIVHDDGSSENGLGWDAGLVSDGIYLDRFDLGPPGGGDIVTRVCLRIGRIGSDTAIDFDVDFWSFDGPGGDPGTHLGSVPATAIEVPVGLPGQFYEVDVSGLGLPAEGIVGAGMRWNPQAEQGFFLAFDETPATPFTDPVGSGDGGANWDNVANGAPNIRTTATRLQEGVDPSIFADGFESGDTSAWSDTVP